MHVRSAVTTPCMHHASVASVPSISFSQRAPEGRRRSRGSMRMSYEEEDTCMSHLKGGGDPEEACA